MIEAMIYLYGLLAWLVFMLTAIANGALRESQFSPRMSINDAKFISTLILSGLLVIEIAIFMNIAADGENTTELLWLGLMWVALTLAFEFGFGRLVAKKPWPELLADYNLPAGRIWPLVPLVLLLAPALIGN